ncbi:MAG TPA: DUF3024 domain-containing protein [Acidimicrobiales bacterium]
MAGVPELDLRKIRNYAAKVVPRDLQDRIRMEVDVRGKTVTIVEYRPPWRAVVDSGWTRQGVARLKYDLESTKWSLYWSDRNGRWHIFDLISSGPIDKMLEEVELDRTNIFWG